jgi:hypothetical protein
MSSLSSERYDPRAPPALWVADFFFSEVVVEAIGRGGGRHRRR